jgi:hypothetical protein
MVPRNNSDELEEMMVLVLIRMSPTHLDVPDSIRKHRSWGLMAQLYSVRSNASWGVGDLRDLADLAAWSGYELGAGFVLVNPLHAAAPSLPVEPSPYLPSTRRFVSPLYLRVQDVPEAAYLDRAARAELDAMRQYRCLFNLCMHPFLTGRPSRLVALRDRVRMAEAHIRIDPHVALIAGKNLRQVRPARQCNRVRRRVGVTRQRPPVGDDIDQCRPPRSDFSHGSFHGRADVAGFLTYSPYPPSASAILSKRV